MCHPQATARAREFDPRPGDLLPHVAIPTTLSAAELSGLAGFTTEDEHEKVGLRGQALIPSAVIYDAELSLADAARPVAGDGHPRRRPCRRDAARRRASTRCRMRWRWMPSAACGAACEPTRAEPKALDARTESQIGAWFSFALPAPAAAGLSHTLGKRIGSRHGIPHGVCSCLLLPHVMRYLRAAHGPEASAHRRGARRRHA